MTARILIVEDEPDMARVLRYNLTQAGYSAVVAPGGVDALAAVETFTPDLILLDWMLPDMPGTDVCRTLRRRDETATTPIIMVSARGEEIDRVVGFELGVDDYVTKPFSVRELLLRVRAILRRRELPEGPEPDNTIAELRMDLPAHQVFVAGTAIAITQLETRLLGFLAANLDRVVGREELLDQVWGPDTDVTTAAVDSHVKRLRIKLGSAGRLLRTVRGVGYTLSTAARPSKR